MTDEIADEIRNLVGEIVEDIIEFLSQLIEVVKDVVNFFCEVVRSWGISSRTLYLARYAKRKRIRKKYRDRIFDIWRGVT